MFPVSCDTQFTRMSNLLDSLLTPMKGEEFRASHLHKHWLLLPGEESRFRDIFGWDDLNEILNTMPLQPPRCRLVQNGTTLPESRYTIPDSTGSHLDAARAMQALHLGATLVLDSVHRLSNSLLRFTEELQQELAGAVQINLYASWRKDTAFDLHWDRHDVFVLQLAGAKHWKVYEPTRLHPLKNDADITPPPSEPPVWDGLLTAGDLLYLPRGWWHTVNPVDEPSLHLTVGLTRATGADVLDHLVRRLQRHAAVRQNVPSSLTGDTAQEYLHTLRQLLLDAADEDLAFVIRECSDRTEPPASSFHLPAGPQETNRSMEPGDRLLLAEPLRFFEDGNAFAAAGQTWTCPPATRPALTLLNRSRPLEMSLLLDAIPPIAHTPLRLLLTALRLRGVLSVVNRPGSGV